MESRRDYRKLMNIKKRNKNYAKATILGAMGLGFFGITTQVNAEEWKANTVEQIKESVKEAKDGIYIIKTGDTLSGISEATGITIETLAKVNNIQNVDLIYAGDKLIIRTEDGKVALVDSDDNVKNEVSLSKEDKQGIKEVQKQDNNNVYTNTGSSSNTNKGNNNNIINTVKPVKPSEGNGGGNTGGTTNPVNPTKPLEKEYVITINHVSEDGEVLSKETRKAKEGTTVEAKALDFTDRNYELVGESTQTVNIKEDTTITFTYKKIDDTKPETEKVNIEVKHLGDDGKVLSTEVIKAEKDSTVKADAKDFTEQGYVLNDEISKEIKATEGATITFNYRKVDVPTPIESFKVITQYVDENGEVLADPKVSDKVEKGTLYKAEAIDINGYTVKGENTQTVLVNSDTTIKFVYTKDETPTNPTNEDKYLTLNIDTDGNNLGQNVDTTKFDKVSEDTKQTVETLDNGNTITTHTTTIVWKAKDVYVPVHTEEVVRVYVDTNGNKLTSTEGYTYVSETMDSGVTTTAENGDTHTVYTITEVWEKAYVPVHTEETITVNVDTNGNVLSSTNGYTYVSESTDGGKTTTQPNGDTHTIYTKTVVWQKDVQTGGVIEGEWNGVYYGGMGNSGMTFATEEEAHDWAFFNNPTGNQKYAHWQVRMAGTNEIRWTIHWL